MRIAALVDRLRQPAYTGENRCEPCTVLNLVIAAILGSAIARRSRVGGALAVGGSVALIYLRGYLVPGTPTLTKRYLPPEVLRWFGKESTVETASGFGADGSAPDSTAEEAGVDDVTDLEAYYGDHGVLEPCADGTDLCLTPAFEREWDAVLDRLDVGAVDADDLVETFDLEPTDDYEIAATGDARVLRRDGAVVGQWPSQAALVADVAAASVLSAFDPAWDRRDAETKGALLNGLRLFLETCPAGDAVVLTEETVESCCQSQQVVAAVCADSEERLFEQPVDPAAD